MQLNMPRGHQDYDGDDGVGNSLSDKSQQLGNIYGSQVDQHRDRSGRREAVGTKRQRKSWKDAGARETSTQGRYSHSWNEHRLNSDGTVFKTGRWSPEEDELLRKAFDDYCHSKGLVGEEKRRLTTETVKGTELHDCWLEISSVFKHRTVRSVMRRAIRLMHPGNHKGAWTDEEKAELVMLVQKHGKAWKKIGSIMNRMPHGVAGTYERLTAGGVPAAKVVTNVANNNNNDLVGLGLSTNTFSQNLEPPVLPGVNRNTIIQTPLQSGVWSHSEEAALINAVRKYGKPVTVDGSTTGFTDIPWNAVSAAVGTRSASQCVSKWSSSSARLLGITWTPESDRALIDAILKDGGENMSEVYWQHLIPGRTAVDCKSRFETLCRKFCGPSAAQSLGAPTTTGMKHTFIELVDILDEKIPRIQEVQINPNLVGLQGLSFPSAPGVSSGILDSNLNMQGLGGLNLGFLNPNQPPGLGNMNIPNMSALSQQPGAPGSQNNSFVNALMAAAAVAAINASLRNTAGQQNPNVPGVAGVTGLPGLQNPSGLPNMPNMPSMPQLHPGLVNNPSLQSGENYENSQQNLLNRNDHNAPQLHMPSGLNLAHLQGLVPPSLQMPEGVPPLGMNVPLNLANIGLGGLGSLNAGGGAAAGVGSGMRPGMLPIGLMGGDGSNSMGNAAGNNPQGSMGSQNQLQVNPAMYASMAGMPHGLSSAMVSNMASNLSGGMADASGAMKPAQTGIPRENERNSGRMHPHGGENSSE